LTAVIRKLHIYAGLLVFSQLVVYGIAGLVATAQPSLERSKVPYRIDKVSFDTRPGEAEKAVAARVFDFLKPAMAHPVPDWFLQHTPDGHLQLDFYNVNGILRVIVLDGELRVEHIRNGIGLFLEDIHAATLSGDQPSGLQWAWAAWNELGIWALLGFCVSGLYLWLATRPGWLWGWATLAIATGAFISFWVALS
jgi:uncharacterized iron-regulated membrane protein